MNFRKRTGLLFCMVALVTFGAMFKLVGCVKNVITAERMAAAQAVESGFSRGLAETFGALNYATKLSYAIDSDNTNNLDLFKRHAQKLVQENEHVTFIAYFKEDTLDYIYPKEQFSSLVGKNMADFSYSVTLAKVVMTPVVEGPTHLFEGSEDVFLFIQPLYIDAAYVGVIVAAMDNDYVLSALGLEELEYENYDYELWRVDLLGQGKTVIAASDETVDFSNAVKQQFSLPATWSISIFPKCGWVAATEAFLIYSAFLVLGFIILGLVVLFYFTFYYKKKLELSRYTNPDSGLSTMQGFYFFVNNRLSKNPGKALTILKVQLGNFRQFTKDIQRDELVRYYAQFKQSAEDRFTKDAVITKISDDSFLIAFFTANQDSDQLIEDFTLQLHWKRRVNNQKTFITPRCSTVTYPEHGRDAAALVKEVSRKFEEAI